MIRILSDSASTSDYATLKKLGADVISLSVSYDGKNELDTEMDMDAFNDALNDRGDNLPMSSQPAIASFESYFKEAAKSKDSVVGVFMSSALSSTFQSALMAAKAVKEKFCEFECRFIDSLATSGPELFAVKDALCAQKEGDDLDTVANVARQATLNSRIMFCPTDLRYLVTGGRLSKVSAKVASKLKIFPIITTIDGKAEAAYKIRTLSRAHDKMFDIFSQDAKDLGLKRVVVQYAGRKGEELDRFVKRVKNHVRDLEIKIESVSPVISVHSGPAVGISYECFSPLKNRITPQVSKLIYEV